MLREALDFPTSGDRGSVALLVGSVLLLLSAGSVAVGAVLLPLLVVALLLQVALRGYYVRVLRVSAADRVPVAPSFGDVPSLFRDGLVAVGVAVAYFLPALVLFAVAAGGNLASAVQNPLQLRDPTTIAAVETVGGLAALLGLFAALAAVYLVPGAVTLYAHERRVRSAFDARVFRGVFSEDYAVGWVLTLLLQAVAYPLVALLYPLLVGVFLHFFLAVAVRYVWGTSFGNALDLEPPSVDREGITPDTTDTTPAVGERDQSHDPPERRSPPSSAAGAVPGPTRSTTAPGSEPDATPATHGPEHATADQPASGDDPASGGSPGAPPADDGDADDGDADDADADTDDTRTNADPATDPMAEESNS